MGALMTLLANVTTIPVTEALPALNQGVDWILVQMTGWFGNFGGFAWTMILFTIMLKLVLFPLDYISRRSMKKNQMIQESLAPQLAKLEKQCKGDKTLYNQKMMQMMRKEGYRLSGACLPSLITLGLFIYIFSALGNYTSYTNAVVYDNMVKEYNTIVQEYAEAHVAEDPSLVVRSTDGEGNEIVSYFMPETTESGEGMFDEAQQKRMAQKYKQINPRWLWIKNTIRPDGFNTAIPTYSEVSSDGIGSPGIGKYIAGEGPEAKEENYNRVMGFVTVTNEDGNQTLTTRAGSIADEYNEHGFKIFGKHLNGWFLLPLLAAAVSFLSQFLTQKMQPQAPGAGGGGAMKVMMVVFPIMMLFFAISYTSGFSLYIITNSLTTLGGTYLINWLAGKELKKKFEKKALEKKRTSYSR